MGQPIVYLFDRIPQRATPVGIQLVLHPLSRSSILATRSITPGRAGTPGRPGSPAQPSMNRSARAVIRNLGSPIGRPAVAGMAPGGGQRLRTAAALWEWPIRRPEPRGFARFWDGLPRPAERLPSAATPTDRMAHGRPMGSNTAPLPRPRPSRGIDRPRPDDLHTAAVDDRAERPRTVANRPPHPPDRAMDKTDRVDTLTRGSGRAPRGLPDCSPCRNRKAVPAIRRKRPLTCVNAGRDDRI